MKETFTVTENLITGEYLVLDGDCICIAYQIWAKFNCRKTLIIKFTGKADADANGLKKAFRFQKSK
jgi:hypothetical protein